LLRDFRQSLDQVAEFRAEGVKAFAETFVTARNTGLGQLMNPLRLCLVGGSFGPDLSLICEMLGRDEVASRIDRALEYIAQHNS